MTAIITLGVVLALFFGAWYWMTVDAGIAGRDFEEHYDDTYPED